MLGEILLLSKRPAVNASEQQVNHNLKHFGGMYELHRSMYLSGAPTGSKSPAPSLVGAPYLPTPR